MDSLGRWLFDPSGLTPHGFCLLWQPGLLWTHAISDLTTGVAYVAISLALMVIVQRRPDLIYRPVVWLFVTFILLCGFTHWLDVVTLWAPAYGVQAVVKAATATASVLTAIVLWRLLPAALAQPSLAQFREINETLRTNADFLDRTGAIAGVGGWEFDIARDRVTWSAEMYRIHGVPPDYLPTVEASIGFYAPEARGVLRAAFEAGVAEGEPWDLELPLDRADGKRIWVRGVATAAFEGGRPIRITGTLQDVTESRNARQALQNLNERAALAADSGGIGIWDWDIENDLLIWDAWMFRLYGVDPGDGLTPNDLWTRQMHPRDRAAADQALQDALAGLKPYDVEFRVIWADGGVHHIHATAHVTRDASGRAVRMIGANWDISEARRLTADLAEQHELLRVTLASIGDGVVTTDTDGRITWLNPIAEQMTGWTAAEAELRALTEVLHIVDEETRAPSDSPLAACRAGRKVVGDAGASVLVARDGREFGIEHSASPIRDGQGEMLGMVIVFHDVTEQRRLSAQMTYRASHDALTGLVNRAEFELRLRLALEKARAEASQSAILYIDLDQFKIVNDSCGHAIGDQLLIQVTRLLSEVVRASDTLARLGGDEFGVLLNDCPLAQAHRLAQRICDRMEDFRFVHEDKRFRVGASIGLAPIDDRWNSTAAIHQAADSASYLAKEAGGNRVHTWFDTDETMRARRRQMQWATRLESALDENRFRLFHQRIEPLGEVGQGWHAEVLLRLLDSDGALVTPGTFLPAAERFQLASRIDRWVLGQVIAWMKDAPHLDRIDTLSVNLSGQSVGDRSFHRWAANRLDEAGPMIRRKLGLEITETAVITNLADAARFIDQVREMGARVALDDFGAGASSFGYLKSLSVDAIKIDGQFIRDLLTDPLDAAAVRGFIDVANVVGVKTVAEFVESPEVLSLLRRMGVDFAQGYLIHRPAPLADVHFA